MNNIVAHWQNVVNRQTQTLSTRPIATWQNNGVTYAERLRLAVQQSGKRPIRISEQARVDNGYLSKLMSGAGGKRPGADINARLALVLEVDSAWLASGKGSPKKAPWGPYFVMKDGNPSDAPPEPLTVDAVLGEFDWPVIDPKAASEIAKAFRKQFAEATEPLPMTYWLKLLGDLISKAASKKK